MIVVCKRGNYEESLNLHGTKMSKLVVDVTDFNNISWSFEVDSPDSYVLSGVKNFAESCDINKDNLKRLHQEYEAKGVQMNKAYKEKVKIIEEHKIKEQRRIDRDDNIFCYNGKIYEHAEDGVYELVRKKSDKVNPDK